MRTNLYLTAILCLICSFLSPTSLKAQDKTPVDIVFLGDSNIWLAGDSCNNHKGWVAWFKDAINPNTCRSYARSGASWSHTDKTKINPTENIAVLGDDNVILNQVIRLGADLYENNQKVPNVIFIAAGGNDAWFTDKRPQEFCMTVDEAMAVDPSELLSKQPNEILSLAEAIRYNTMLLKAMLPKSKIIFLTSTPMVKVEPELMKQVCDIIEDTGLQMGIPTLRLDIESPINRDEEIAEHINTYDGVHTNETGAERLGNYVAAKVKPLLTGIDR